MDELAILLTVYILLCQSYKVNLKAINYLGRPQPFLDTVEIDDPDHLVQTTTATSLMECLRYCTGELQCMSFSYNKYSQACIFYDVVYGSAEKGVAKNGTRHYNAGEVDRCPMLKGYIHFRNTDGCYKPLSTGSDFDGAMDICVMDGGHLIKLNDDTEKQAIRTVFRASTGYKVGYWTGAYKDGPGNTWVWRDGTAVILSLAFRPGEPSGGVQCAYFHVNDDGFNDFPCGNWPKPLCEIDMP